MKSSLPNFIIAGATRSGTTSLRYYLRQHPDIFFPKGQQEAWVFNVDEKFKSYQKCYKELFEGLQNEKIRVEVTPMYFHKGMIYRTERRETAYFDSQDSAIKRISQELPQAKILVTLREPVSRWESIYYKNYFQGKKGVPGSINQKAQEDLNSEAKLNNFVYLNRYAVHLRHLLEQFSKENIKVIIFEEWTREPQRYLREILKFLGVKEDFEFEVKAVNKGSRYKRRVSIGEALKVVENPSLLLSGNYWRSWGRSLKSWGKEKNGSRLTKESRRDLQKAFQEDVKFVEKFLGRKIETWCNF